MKASDKQIGYALALLGKAGYSVKWMNAAYKDLGATMRERSGTVSAWLSKMNTAEISALIDRLKEEE